LTEFPSIPNPLSVIGIYLCENDLKTIPDSIDLFENLEELFLGKCGLTELPKTISNLKKLRVLYLSGNKLSRVPFVPTVERLYLDNNLIIDLPNFKKLNRLTHLYLGKNRIEKLSEMPETLQELDLSDNSVIENSTSYRELSNIKHIYLNGKDVIQGR
jgi:Leucine-rich repeat (LRR) protein